MEILVKRSSRICPLFYQIETETQEKSITGSYAALKTNDACKCRDSVREWE